MALGHGVELAGGELPYGTITETLRTLTRDTGPKVVQAAAGPYAAQLAALYPPLNDTTDAQPETSVDRMQLLPAYVTTLENLAGDRLVWLAVEDLHWVDASSLDALTYLIRVAHGSQLLILATARPHDPAAVPSNGDRVATLTSSGNVDRLNLRPLDRSDTAALIADLTGGDTTAAHVDRVVTLSQGNPLLTEQLVAAGDDTGRVPESVTGPMTARISRLDADTRRLLQVASLAEGHLAHRLLKQAYGDDSTFDTAAAVALDANLLQYDPDGQAYTFTHALLRRAADDTLRPADRMATHRRWAELLGADPLADLRTLIAVAHHWAAAGGDDQAFTTSLDAAERARQLSAATEEANLTERALELWHRVSTDTRGDRRRDRLLVQCVGAWSTAGNNSRGRDLLRKELALPGSAERDPLRHLRLQIGTQYMGDLAGEPWDRDVMEQALGHAEELLACEPDPFVAGALSALAWYVRFTDPDTSYRLHQRMWEMAVAVGESGDKIVLFCNYQDQLLQRALFDDALAGHNLVRPHARTSTDRVLLDSVLAEILHALGRFGEEAEVLDRMDRLMPTPDLAPVLWAGLRMEQGELLLATGDIERARTLLTEASDDTSDLPDVKIWVATRLGILEVLCGNLDAAHRDAVAARARLPRNDADAFLPNLIYTCELEAAAAAANGDLLTARGIVAPLVRSPILDVYATLWRAVLVAALIEGDIGQALETHDAATAVSVNALRSAVERLPCAGPHYTARRLQAAADLDRADRADTPATWAAVAEAWRTVGHIPHLAWAAFRLADACVRAGDTDAAQAALTEAMHLAASLGAQPLHDAVIDLARRARITLTTGPADTSAGDRRATGPLARLTERELEVLRHIALGESNHEIGAALFISPKTVSVHVSRILAKFDVTSRAKATALAYEHGLLG